MKRALLLVLLSSCAHAQAPSAPSTAVSSTAASSTASSTRGATPQGTSATTERHPLHFIEDDYPRALAEARAKQKPLFVDTWATWCHTCVSMKAYVFPDPKLDAYAEQFVWLSLDTEKKENASFVASHPMEAWPTLWVIDSASEKVVLKWSNSATASELGSLLEDTSLGMKRGDSGGDAGAALVRGNQATADRKPDVAIAEYRTALKLAPADWPKRANAVEALVTQLGAKKEDAACAETVLNELPRIHGGTSRATSAIVGLHCADQAPQTDASRAMRARLVDAIRTMALDPHEPILADDRSGLFEELVDALHADKKDAAAHEAAAAWAAFLEGEASRAGDAAARAVFDPHRLNAYVDLGEPSRAIPMLEASERDFPADYNPPARLARAYFEMRRYDDALAAIDRALSRAYGPRTLRLDALKADILEKKGDRRGAAEAIRAAIASAKTMTLSGGYPSLVVNLGRRLDTLEAASAK